MKILPLVFSAKVFKRTLFYRQVISAIFNPVQMAHNENLKLDKPKLY